MLVPDVSPKEPCTGDNSNHSSSSSDITMDASSGSRATSPASPAASPAGSPRQGADKVVVPSTAEKRRPMKKRKSLHLDLPSEDIRMAAQDTSVSDDSDHGGEQQRGAKRSKPKKAPINHGFGQPIATAAVDSAMASELSPQINDVLMGNGSASSAFFNHIGNRRFRVLVEANLPNYFSDMTTPEQWQAFLDTGLKAGKRQHDVVASVITSIKGNLPPGRFLIRLAREEEKSCKEEPTRLEPATGYDGDSWKVATEEGIEAKVHSTFLAAGRFHVKQNIVLAAAAAAAAARDVPREDDDMGTTTTLAQNLMDIEAANTKGMPSEDAPSPGLEEETAEEMDVVTSSSSNVSTASSVDTKSAPSSGNASPTNIDTKDVVSNSTIDKSTAAVLDEALRIAISHGTLPSSVNSSVSTASSEVDYLAKESMRINAILNQGKDTVASQQESLVSLVPNYLPSRNIRKAAGAYAGAAVGVPTLQQALQNMGGQHHPSGALPTSIEEMYASSRSSSPGATSPLASSRASSDGSISPQLLKRGSFQVPLASMPRRGSIQAKRRSFQSANSDALAAAANAVAMLSDTQLMVPTRVKVFLALSMDAFFVEDHATDASSSANAVPPTVLPSSYIIPSNYDVLCGQGQSFFHHVGNRRFRIMIEMNVPRYEQAYLASLVSGDASGEEDATQTLIEEMLTSLSKCDPPGKFLGMDMSTGRWRVLNPVFAQLKTEQTFFECLQVKQRRQARLQQEERKQQASQQADQDWNSRIEIEKELLTKELEGRMLANGVDMRPQPTLSRETGRRVSTCSMSDSTATGPSCPLRNMPPNLAANEGEDIASLQSQAKELLKRRQSAPMGTMTGPTYQTAIAQGIVTTATPPTDEELKAMGMMEIVKRFSHEHQSTGASRAMLHSFQGNNSALSQEAVAAAAMSPQGGTQRSSVPILSNMSLMSNSFSIHDMRGNEVGSNSFSMMPKRGSHMSCESNDSIQSFSEQQLALLGAGRRPSQIIAERRPSQTIVSSQINCNNVQQQQQHHQVKDLLDVVGGMMMMSQRRSPC